MNKNLFGKQRPQKTPSYDSIFSNDPLLLNEENQKAFSDILEEQTLRRGNGRLFESTDLDLMERSERDWFASHVSTAPSYGPTQKLRSYYNEQLRRQDTTVNSEHEDSLKEHTIVPLRSKTDVRYKSLPSISSKTNVTDCLRIAAISYQVGISKHFERPHFGEQLSLIAPSSITSFPLSPFETDSVDQLGRTVCSKAGSKEVWLHQTRWH